MQDSNLLLMLNAIGTACTVLLAHSAFQLPAPATMQQKRALRYFRLALVGWALAFAIGSLQLFSANWPALRPVSILFANLTYCSSYFCILVAVATRYQYITIGIRTWHYAALLALCSMLVIALLDNFLLRNLLIPTLCTLLLGLALRLSYLPAKATVQPRHRGDQYLRLSLLLLLLNLLLTNLLMVPLTAPGIPTSTRLLMFILHNGILLTSAINSIFHYDLTEKIRHEGQTDALTGVYNRKILPQLQPQAADCVLMADLDHFKRINDTYGHDAGDYVIQQFAVLLQHAIRPADAVIRMGGEEFLILLRQTDISAAQQITERLCRQVAATALNFNGTPLQITASFGLCPVGQHDLKQAVQQADQLLYLAKQQGRNRLVTS